MEKRKDSTIRKATISGALTTYEYNLDETEKDFVVTHPLKSGKTGAVIDVKVPKLKKILIRGEVDTLAIRLADKDNNDIRWDTRIKIAQKVRGREEIVIVELPYSDINALKIDKGEIVNKEYEEYYRFKKGMNIYIHHNEHLKIYAVSPDRDIEENIRLHLDVSIGIF